MDKAFSPPDNDSRTLREALARKYPMVDQARQFVEGVWLHSLSNGI
jgi:hypothetical protein